MKPYYEHGGMKIYHGDCREVLPELETVESVVTDPPYNCGKKYLSYHDDLPEDLYLSWLGDVFGLCGDILVPAGPLVWWWQGLRVAKGEVLEVLPDGFFIHHLAGWFKREFAGDKYCGTRPAMCWEPIIWAVKDPGPACYHGGKGGALNRDMISALHVRHDKVDTCHPCPKTLVVVATIVSWVVPPDGIVLDPFMGSGTTLRAAKDLGRKAIGIEIEERYCEMAAERLAQEVMNFETA